LEVGVDCGLMEREGDFLIEELVLGLEKGKVWRARRDNYY
jgi:hypothetical protein